jgi:hypothetical protein
MNFPFFNFRMPKRIAVFFGVFVAVGSFFISGADMRIHPSIIGTVFADDDDDEDEDDDDEDDEDEDDDDDDRKEKKETISVTRYEVRKVTQIVTVLAPEYEKDTDGDLLVDGIDPNPLVHQKEYFTDTDGDSVPDAFDRYHGEDDFAYFEEDDADRNGIIDAYERMAER